MKNTSNYAGVLCRLSQDIFSHPSAPFEGVFGDFPDDISFIKFLVKNRLVHLLALRSDIEQFDGGAAYKEEWKRYVRTLVIAMEDLDAILADTRWAMFKTISCYPHLTTDIDILVESPSRMAKAQEALKKLGWNHSDGRLRAPGLCDLEVDLGTEVSWTPSGEVSREFLWDHMETAVFEGREYLRPDSTLDVMARIAHMPFELAEARLGELLHMFEQGRTANWNAIAREAAKMGWAGSYKRTMRLLSSLRKGLYGDDFGGFSVSCPALPLTFPCRLPYSHLAQSVIEKRAWSKIWGARYVLKDRVFG